MTRKAAKSKSALGGAATSETQHWQTALASGTPSAQSPHVMIRASAGTGKTFQLSNRFLKLAADGQPVDQILAVTFTRAAAGEILERVLMRLADAADDPAKLAGLAEQLERPGLARADCVALLRLLTTNLHRLQIGTLDSFFFRLAGNFGLELGLPLGWQIADEIEEEQIRADAIQRLLAACELGDAAALVHLLNKGEAVRSVTREINDVVKSMYDVFRETATTPEAWDRLPRRAELDPAQLADALTALAALPPSSNKSFEKGRLADLGQAGAQDWDGLVASGIAGKILGGESSYSRVPFSPELLAAYQPLLEHAKATLVNRLANQTEGTRRLLDQFDTAFRPLKVTRRALRFDDLTLELAGALADGRLRDVAWRMDSRVSHLLLDEFQDTSLAQWSVLRPLVAQVCHGSDRSFFCVGDVKQAIYGWRGGTAELFNTVTAEVPGIREENLTKSFRSSPAVIELVNRVFGNIASNPVVAKYDKVARDWAAQFQTHTTAQTELPGRCRLLVAPQAGTKINSKEQQRAALHFAGQRIAALAAETPGRTIGVLVRRNQAIAPLIYELRHRHKLPVSEEGGNPLTDSPAVELILSLLALADHPGDTAARFHVAHSPLGTAVGLPAYDDDAMASRLARQIRRRLLDNGYGPTLYGWVQALGAVLRPPRFEPATAISRVCLPLRRAPPTPPGRIPGSSSANEDRRPRDGADSRDDGSSGEGTGVRRRRATAIRRAAGRQSAAEAGRGPRFTGQADSRRAALCQSVDSGSVAERLEADVRRLADSLSQRVALLALCGTHARPARFGNHHRSIGQTAGRNLDARRRAAGSAGGGQRSYSGGDVI